MQVMFFKTLHVFLFDKYEELKRDVKKKKKLTLIPLYFRAVKFWKRSKETLIRIHIGKYGGFLLFFRFLMAPHL